MDSARCTPDTFRIAMLYIEIESEIAFAAAYTNPTEIFVEDAKVLTSIFDNSCFTSNID